MSEQELTGTVILPARGCRACSEEAARAEILSLVAAGELQIVQLPDGSVAIGPTRGLADALPLLAEARLAGEYQMT